jgi:hypothetical protein
MGTEQKESVDSPTEKKSMGGKILLTYLIVGIVFPTLLTVFLNVWKLPMMLLTALHAPLIIRQIVSVIGIVMSIGGAFWCCREIWRRRPR